jgi:predicted transcriptional regulator
MRTITTTSGAEIVLDGDLLSIMETLYREVTARKELERSFEDMIKEIKHLIDQMDESERRAYLLESLFLNTVKYENDKLEAYMRRLTRDAGQTGSDPDARL